MDRIGRLLTAMVTPFDHTGAVDYAQAQRLARALVDSGSDGLVVSGTTGESPTLSHDEKLKLFEAVKGALGQRGTVVAGTGGNNTAESIRLTQEAERLGVDGILLVVPYYNRPTQEGLYLHFRAIAESTRLPCILYNVPGRTVTSLAPETVARLSAIRNIVGIKEASGNLEQIARIMDATPSHFRVWSGNDGDTFPIMALGGYGVISVASHLVGKQMKELVTLCVEGKMPQAATLHRRLLPLFSALFIVANPIPVKHALNAVGFRVGSPRLPLTPLDEKSAAQLEAVLKTQGIDLPIPAST